MRLGIDASNLRAGGGVTHLVELLHAARPQEHGIRRVIIWAGQNTLKEIPAKPWLERVHEPMLDQPLPVRLYWQKVKLSQLANQHCDCLFVPGGSYSGAFRPFVTMSRNLLPFERAERRRYGLSWMFVKLFLLRLGQTRSLHNADGVIFLTEYARSVVKQATNLNGYQPIIPHGINKCFYLPPRAQRPISDYSLNEPFRLLYVSTVDVYKHQWHVVEAVARLRKEGVPLALDLVGPVYQPALRRLRKVITRVDLGEGFIRYRGPVPYSELVSYYHRADGFAFASSCENMPNILLEAMASALPIACSDRGPMPEMLGDAGAYFNPEQPGEIAKALRSLIEDPALREHHVWSAHNRAQSYSWERCARETFSYLAEVAQSTSSL
ncbi:MAG: glycosyltransferase family 4 protein [Pyrinomonadaceae bacterium]|nr:glycosyltransferase family 4 protein [Pyrinomonadaceae bacterium]